MPSKYRHLPSFPFSDSDDLLSTLIRISISRYLHRFASTCCANFFRRIISNRRTIIISSDSQSKGNERNAHDQIGNTSSAAKNTANRAVVSRLESSRIG